MSHNTPNSIKRRMNARMLANNPFLKQMELRAHTETLEVYKEDIVSTISEPRYQQHNFKVSKELIQSQPEITLPMRPILFEFLLEVHSRLKLTNQVFYSTINIIDRYSSVRIVRKDHLQLLGLTALWISCKFFEIKSKIPNLQFLNATCCNCYSTVLFTEMENHILKTLEWEISSKTHDFLIDLKVIELTTNHEQRFSFKYSANFICQFLQFHADITLRNTIEDIVDSTLVLCGQALNIDITTCLGITPNCNLINQIAETLNMYKSDFPQAIKAKYFCNTDNFFSNGLLTPLFHHPKVSPPKLQEFICPNTPASSDSMSLFSACSTVASPFTFRAPLSKQSSVSSNFISTPPSSGAPSPVESVMSKRVISSEDRESKRSRLCEIEN